MTTNSEETSKDEENEEKLSKLEETFEDKFKRLCGFQLEDIKSWDKFVRLMYRPTDPSSLGIARILFGKVIKI